jgi:hypothetical protein
MYMYIHIYVYIYIYICFVHSLKFWQLNLGRETLFSGTFIDRVILIYKVYEQSSLSSIFDKNSP